jgi:ABC-type protease/lipase transport system fused ATPase/permease subunit
MVAAESAPRRRDHEIANALGLAGRRSASRSPRHIKMLRSQTGQRSRVAITKTLSRVKKISSQRLAIAGGAFYVQRTLIND